jgi:hypothetical protein
MASSVMPVWHDVHRTRGATFFADKALADLRPGATLRQGIQPDVDQPIAAAVTLDVAGYVAFREPFRRASWRVVAGHVARLPSRTGSMHALMKAMPNPIRKLSIPWGSEHPSDDCRSCIRTRNDSKSLSRPNLTSVLRANERAGLESRSE